MLKEKGPKENTHFFKKLRWILGWQKQNTEHPIHVGVSGETVPSLPCIKRFTWYTSSL